MRKTKVGWVGGLAVALALGLTPSASAGFPPDWAKDAVGGVTDFIDDVQPFDEMVETTWEIHEGTFEIGAGFLTGGIPGAWREAREAAGEISDPILEGAGDVARNPLGPFTPTWWPGRQAYEGSGDDDDRGTPAGGDDQERDETGSDRAEGDDTPPAPEKPKDPPPPDLGERTNLAGETASRSVSEEVAGNPEAAKGPVGYAVLTLARSIPGLLDRVPLWNGDAGLAYLIARYSCVENADAPVPGDVLFLPPPAFLEQMAAAVRGGRALATIPCRDELLATAATEVKDEKIAEFKQQSMVAMGDVVDMGGWGSIDFDGEALRQGIEAREKADALAGVGEINKDNVRDKMNTEPMQPLRPEIDKRFEQKRNEAVGS